MAEAGLGSAQELLDIRNGSEDLVSMEYTVPLEQAREAAQTPIVLCVARASGSVKTFPFAATAAYAGTKGAPRQIPLLPKLENFTW